ncbi:MAG: DUF4058 family protein [Phormidesmis sp.]
MPSPFPGMNPYLENPELWPEAHSRLIVAIADALNPQLIPKYRAAIDRRIYVLEGSETLLVGIPDVTVERRTSEKTSPTRNNVVIAVPPTSPLKVRVPMPLEIRESYLQIKEMSTGEVITAVGILSPTNKRPGQRAQCLRRKAPRSTEQPDSPGRN